MRKLMADYRFVDTVKNSPRGKAHFRHLRRPHRDGDRVDGKKQDLLNLIDLDVERNAYGPSSRAARWTSPARPSGRSPFTPFHPGPADPGSRPAVEKLALYQGEVVLARQNNILVAAFHPELTGDARCTSFFCRCSPAGHDN